MPAYPTKGKGAWRPLLSAQAGASKRETPTSNLSESTVLDFKSFPNIFHSVSFAIAWLEGDDQANVNL